MIWILPHGDADFALRSRLIKSGFWHRLPPVERISASRVAKGEHGIWQRRYWEHTLRDEDDFARHLDYIQSGQARPCGPGVRLAALVDPPLGPPRCLSAGLGGRSRR
jgi:hypothetical protein